MTEGVGTLAILNVGAGDTKLTFDITNPDELARSAAIVKDMIRKGFALLIEVGRDEKGPLYRRAYDFDEKTAEYIVAGVASEPEIENEQSPKQKAPAAPRRGGKRETHRIPAAKATAVAVARTAGG